MAASGVPDPRRWLVAVQVGAASLVDEGVEPCLETLQRLGAANTLFLADFTYTRGTGGRQVPGHPLPDHGAQEYDADFIGGDFAGARPEYHPGTFIRPQDFRAPDHPGLDLLERVLPAARARGLAVYSWMEESSYGPQLRRIPGFWRCLEVDHLGRLSGRPCLRNPDYRNWHLGLIEERVAAYGVDGVAWCSERNGPLQAALMSWSPTAFACFCPHCLAAARAAGIEAERARAGFVELQRLVERADAGDRPRDGYFVTFWRLLLRHPELLAWDRLWHEGQDAFLREAYGLVHGVGAGQVRFGWHIMHLGSFSPFYRATQDVAAFSHYADFLKLVAYNNCAGPRWVLHLRALHRLFFADARPEETVALLYRLLGVDEETDLEAVARQGWSADYVGRETARALAGVARGEGGSGRTHIYPGIDIDIPTGPDEKRTTPADVRAAVEAALGAGAQGVVLSRKYSEMRLENLAAAGAAVRAHGQG